MNNHPPSRNTPISTINTEPTTTDANYYLVVKDNNNSGQSVANTTTNITINPNNTGTVLLDSTDLTVNANANNASYTGTLVEIINLLSSRITVLENSSTPEPEPPPAFG